MKILRKFAEAVTDQQIHSISESIRDLYEAYPYPTRMPGGSADPFLEYLYSFTGKPHSGTRTFFDAGCGTGLNVLGGAAVYPHFQVYGCDLNRVALEQLRTEASQLGIQNLHLKEMDLLNLDQDFGPSEGFDIIFSTGVIHHTADPVGVLKSMAKRLAPQGILRLMVYGKSGRRGLYRFAGAARQLFAQDSWQERVQKSREMLQESVQTGLKLDGFAPPVARGYWQDVLRVDDIEFADRYLNPHDQPFNVSSLKEAVDSAGLEFHSWFETRDWNLESLLPEFSRSELAPKDPWEQFKLIEQLFDRHMLDLYLVKPGYQRREIELTPETVVGLNPQLFLNCTKARGASFHRMAQLRLGAEVVLSRDEGELLESLGLRFLPIQELAKELTKPSVLHWMATVEDLVKRHFLFVPNV